jgi:predicted HTH domain antitoxin
MRLVIELEVPDGAVIQGAETDFIRSVKEQTALKLYADERITTGEAAAMLGLTRIEFLDLLRRTGTGFRVELDDEDFAQIRPSSGRREVYSSDRPAAPATVNPDATASE